MDIKSLNDLVLWNPPSVKFYIGQGVLSEGSKLILFGSPKIGKSVLIQQLGFNLVTHSPWLGLPTEPASVLYFQAEIAARLFRGRILKMWGNFRGPHKFNYWTDTVIPPPKLDTDFGMKQISSALSRFKPMVLIIDPLYRFVAAMNMDSLQRFADNLDRLIDQYATTIVVVSHPRKTQIDSAGASVNFGTEELWGPRILEWYFDSILYLQGDIDEVDRELSFTLRNSETLWFKKSISLDKSKLLFS